MHKLVADANHVESLHRQVELGEQDRAMRGNPRPSRRACVIWPIRPSWGFSRRVPNRNKRNLLHEFLVLVWHVHLQG
jgi:hypothetical protein